MNESTSSSLPSASNTLGLRGLNAYCIKNFRFLLKGLHFQILSNRWLCRFLKDNIAQTCFFLSKWKYHMEDKSLCFTEEQTKTFVRLTVAQVKVRRTNQTFVCLTMAQMKVDFDCYFMIFWNINTPICQFIEVFETTNPDEAKTIVKPMQGQIQWGGAGAEYPPEGHFLEVLLYLSDFLPSQAHIWKILLGKWCTKYELIHFRG